MIWNAKFPNHDCTRSRAVSKSTATKLQTCGRPAGRPAPPYSAYRTSILSRFFPSVNAVFWTISTFCCLLRVQDLDFVTFFVVAKTGPFFAKIALVIALFFVVFQTQNGSSGPPFLRGLRKDVPEKWGVTTPFLAIFKINGKKGLF